jgi:hypothetical protein
LYFFSSNPVEILNVKVEKNDVSGNASNIQELANVAKPQLVDDKYTITSNSLKKPVTLKVVTANANNADSRNYIYFEHQLDNNMSSESDYSEYIVTFNVPHTGDNRYIETVRITQYPMIYIKADPNSKPNETGGVYVNSENSKNASYGGVHGLTGNNKNPNRYIISVSALDTGSSYIIGDPRKSTVDNLNTTFASARTMQYTGDTGNRALKYYHPTVETSASENMISPQFMIASSYGVTNPISKENARNRCATYQEDGYPAGRWRLPTQAEIQYIVQLSAWGIIPTLFGTENSNTATKYWSANGAVNVTPATGTVKPSSDTSNGPVRCVYDTWYWTDKCSKKTFTWGDKATF